MSVEEDPWAPLPPEVLDHDVSASGAAREPFGERTSTTPRTAASLAAAATADVQGVTAAEVRAGDGTNSSDGQRAAIGAPAPAATGERRSMRWPADAESPPNPAGPRLLQEMRRRLQEPPPASDPVAAALARRMRKEQQAARQKTDELAAACMPATAAKGAGRSAVGSKATPIATPAAAAAAPSAGEPVEPAEAAAAVAPMAAASDLAVPVAADARARGVAVDPAGGAAREERDPREREPWFAELPAAEQERLRAHWRQERHRFDDRGKNLRCRLWRATWHGAVLFGFLGLLQAPLLGFGSLLPLVLWGAIAAFLAQLAGGGRFTFAFAGMLAFFAAMGVTVVLEPLGMIGGLICSFGLGALGLEGEMRRSGGFHPRD